LNSFYSLYNIHNKNLLQKMDEMEQMEPVSNRDYLLQFFAQPNNFYNFNNFYIYNNIFNNYYIYSDEFQPAAAGENTLSPSASALETFERLRIDVCKVPQEAQAQDKAKDGCEGAYSCSVCQSEQKEENEEENEMVKTKCNHVFHSKCLAKWVVIKTSCPICRASLTMKIT